jgi:hypothetical protein
MTYTITVRALVPFEDRDPDDQQDDPTGEHSREEALDLFHGTVPIAVLDHFEITCEEA